MINILQITTIFPYTTHFRYLLAQVRMRIGDQTLTAVITADAIKALTLRRGDDGGERLVADPHPDLREQPVHADFFDDTLQLDRKSTRLNSSHVETSYAVFCL